MRVKEPVVHKQESDTWLIKRIRDTYEIKLGEGPAKGLFALLSGQPNAVTPEQLQQGQTIYAWLFQDLQKLALDYTNEYEMRKKT